ncbi:D,D-heptose 7-phosphate kinase [Acidisarcina polymorpha]|uniref:D,D-heptose 7-phosphate kinase n=1 Tax=Acidisarcina polymorpha TaxID=2211140 RepID=A0A2Z5FY40_9BACT|nr:galactokinase [Acidisarcina polymorpha]AXC11799.1 D,D-heptose 7-phosphate kinase [Acidisarcina polymorpha]
MILTRTPLRISIGGGGTDLPSYYREFGGFVVSAAIDKYVYVGVNRNFLSGYILKFSELEHSSSREAIRHPLVREALRLLDVEDGLEIVSIADVPGGTGLGSSGSFLVGLLHALHTYQGVQPKKAVTPETLATEATEIELTRLKRPVGKQDQFIAAYGGLLCQEYHPDETATVTPLRIAPRAIAELENSLMLFFVGQTRSSSLLLEDQRRKSEEGDSKIIDSLHFAKQLGLEIRDLLQAGEVRFFGPLMHEHWLRKRARSSGISTPSVDEAYELAMREGGATGGKLVGAEGGGFLLFQTEDRSRLRLAMAKTGMKEMPFRFDFEGSVVNLRHPFGASTEGDKTGS